MTNMDEDHLEEIIARRMGNTGETYRAARAAVLRAEERIAASASHDQSWVPAWTSPGPRDDYTVRWLRARPESLWPLLIRFPPRCVVRAREGAVMLVAPAPGAWGIVSSYGPPRAGAPDGTIACIDHPRATVIAECEPDWVEVVGYWHGWDSARVREVLA